MVRAGLLAVAVTASVLGTGAEAATIAQLDNEVQQLGFDRFDASLGQLNSVTLTVNVFNRYRDWALDVASDVPTSRQVGWSINGLYGVNTLGLPTTFFSITGAGTSNVALNDLFDGRAYGTFTISASGAATFSLDPSLFLYDGSGTRRFGISGFDTGFFQAGANDTTFTIAGPHRLQKIGGCFRLPLGEDSCGSVGYSLTYDYTPVGAIPEPGTWAMMLIGFGAIGAAMRRAKRAQAKLRTASA